MKEPKYIDFLSHYFDIHVKSNDLFTTNVSFRIEKAFSFLSVDMNGFPFVIAQYQGKRFNVHEINYVKKLIEKDNKDHVIFYFDMLTKQNKMSLTNYGIGYVIGTTQFFIPELSVLINEHYNYKPERADKNLSFGAQNILFKLLVLDEDEYSLKDLSKILEEKEYETYRSVKELENMEIIKVDTFLGYRTVSLSNKKAMWEKAKTHLKFPNIIEIYVDKNSLFNQNIPLVEAGQYALSNKGMIIANEEIYAIENRHFTNIKDQIKETFDGDQKAVKLQIWKSRIVKTSNDEINPFALYLSLQTEKDERVQKDYEAYISKYWR